ncbi:hypothetical protein CE91St28_06440 [Pyramidobacter piscolens]|nr:hypothetical protein CE91St28_06440 [Pyramidobacter piscolens]
MDAELNRIMCELFVEALALAGVMVGICGAISALWKRRRS